MERRAGIKFEPIRHLRILVAAIALAGLKVVSILNGNLTLFIENGRFWIIRAVR